MPTDALNDARHEVAQLITQGYVLFNEGKSDEAKAAAVMALEADPHNNSALALRSMCFERDGDIAKALEGYERVLEMNPDSALDRIKVNQLRTILATQASRDIVTSEQGSKRAMIAALGFGLLALAIGTISVGYLATRKPAEDTASLVKGGPTVESSAFLPNAAATKAPQTNAASTTTQQGIGNPVSITDPTTTGSTSTGNDVVPSSGTGGQQGVLPNANRGLPIIQPDTTYHNPTTNDPGPIFLDPRIIPENTTGPAVNPKNGGSDPPPDTTPPVGGTDANVQPKSDGTIEISVSHRNKPNVGGSEDAGGNGGGAEALLSTARSQYQVRNFPAAARAYEQALKLGADSGSTNQRLGQCYEQLGRSSDALGAYKRAVAAFEAQVASNPENRKAKRALDACKLSVKVLGG